MTSVAAIQIQHLLSETVLTVRSVTPATPSTRIVRLDLAGRAFPFEAGQAALIGLAQREERVPYSIASSPTETARSGLLEFLIKVEDSGRWGHQFDVLEAGQEIGVQGPFGTFLLPPEAVEKRLLFIAGGTGIAPIRAMIREALARGHRGRIGLLYSAKTADDFAYLSELTELSRDGTLDLSLHVTRGEVNFFAAARGRVGLAQLTPLVDDPSTFCFVCGPESMMADVPRMLLELGIERERVRVEEW
jgi:ferredoxin-NADP reductase